MIETTSPSIPALQYSFHIPISFQTIRVLPDQISRSKVPQSLDIPCGFYEESFLPCFYCVAGEELPRLVSWAGGLFMWYVE